MKSTRRGLLASLALTPVFVPADIKAPEWSDARNPHLNLDGNGFAEFQRRQLRILIDGEDVTNRCFFYDQKLSMCGLYCEKGGQKYAEIHNGKHSVATEWKHGTLTFRKS